MSKKRRKVGFAPVKDWFVFHEGFVFCVISLAALLLVIVFAYTYDSFVFKGITFSKPSGFYSEDQYIEISKAGLFFNNGGVIKYNLNGDDLDDNNLEYSSQIKLEVPEEGYKLYTIRAAVCLDECEDEKIATYVLGKKLDQDITLDIVSISSSQKNLYDYDTGIMVPGRVHDDALRDGLVDEAIIGNYSIRTNEWIKDSYIVVFDTNGKVVLDKKVGLAISGGASAALDKKSLKIVGDRNKGYDGVLFDFDGLKEYDSMRLRSGGQDQDSGNIRSSVASRLAKQSNFPGICDTKRIVVFLNGDYYGVFDAQQNYSKEYLTNRFNITGKNNIEKQRGNENFVLEQFGFKEMLDRINNKNGDRDVEKYIDMGDFLRYYAIQILWNNTDWPMNNYEAWRTAKTINEDNPYEDGRLRFLIYDTDLIYYSEKNRLHFENADGDLFKNLMENKDRAFSSSFRNVMKSDFYRNEFINILEEYMNGAFKTENVLRIINEEAEKIEHQMELFYTESEYEEWQKWIEIMKETAKKRNDEVRADVKRYFGIDL